MNVPAERDWTGLDPRGTHNGSAQAPRAAHWLEGRGLGAKPREGAYLQISGFEIAYATPTGKESRETDDTRRLPTARRSLRRMAARGTRSRAAETPGQGPKKEALRNRRSVDRERGRWIPSFVTAMIIPPVHAVSRSGCTILATSQCLRGQCLAGRTDDDEEGGSVRRYSRQSNIIG